MTDALFGHNPDRDIDWSIECEELENIVTNLKLGLTGFGHEDDYDNLGHRLAKFLDYSTICTEIRELKRQLRNHIYESGFTMSPQRYIGSPVLLYRRKISRD